MYGKFFASTYTGSMIASGPEVFAVWGYVISHAVSSTVELNPRLLAAVIGSTPDRMKAAIEKLCEPDPESRSKDEEGRRLIREGEFQYRVVNHDKYRNIRDEEGRREYNRLKQQEHRQRKAQSVKQQVNDSQSLSSVSAHTDTDEEAKKTTSPAPDGFDDFWASWPKTDRKQDKKKCSDVWRKKKLSPSKAEIIAHVEALKRTRKWREGYEPAPLTYLNGERWRDGMPELETGDLLTAGDI